MRNLQPVCLLRSRGARQAVWAAALFVAICSGTSGAAANGREPTRQLRFSAESPQSARAWQREARETLFRLMMGGGRPQAPPLAASVLRREEDPAGGFWLEEVTFQSLSDRRVHAWLALPHDARVKRGAILALHGHGGTGEDVVRGRGLYWYGRALAEMGYVVIAPDIGSHAQQHAEWTLMGERTWDAIRCLDYLASRPEADTSRIAVAGLSLGGETAMYVAALDERVRAVDSSGWLTTVANMKDGHCPCWNFPGLEAHFDFADIFACVAPRSLVLEVGMQEQAPGGFPVEIARAAFAEIQAAYAKFGAADRVVLDVHPGGHIFRGATFWARARAVLGVPEPYARRGRDLEAGGASEALRRGELARRCLVRAQRVLEAWWALRDVETGLFPRRTDQPVWAPQDNAADMLPFLYITAHFLAPNRLAGMEQALRSERALTSRWGPLPDWYALTNRAFLYPEIDPARVLFGAAEYCKDGLVPMTEILGRGPWSDRLVELMDAIFERAPVVTDHGRIPADDAEVCGDLLQALARLHGLTRAPRYVEWAGRVADAWCVEVLPHSGGLPPYRWDFPAHRARADRLNLNDHGNELLGGLAEWYILASHHDRERAARHGPILRAMYQRLLDGARNEDGFWYNLVEPSTGAVLNRETPDTWGYALAATLTLGQATGDASLIEAGRFALGNLDKPRYLDWDGADSYADSIEGGLLLLNRLPSAPASLWLERILPLFLARQQETGIVEGWYGDGNYARTALMVAFYLTQGTHCRPWRPDLRWGAVREGGRLRIALQAREPWTGRLCFDTARHRQTMGLPANYARLNEFPEWYVVDPGQRYSVRTPHDRGLRTGDLLAAGLPLELTPGKVVVVEVSQE